MNMRSIRRQVADPALLMRLKTRQLVLLAQLGSERNLGRAATAMGISQPAGTKLLQQLEDVLGVELFKRLARGMEPTAAGEVLIRYARQMLSDFALVREEMRALRSGLRGSLRVGSVPGAVPGLLAPALVQYKQRHPRVALSVVVDTSDVMLAQLGRGEVDLVLGRPGFCSHRAPRNAAGSKPCCAKRASTPGSTSPSRPRPSSPRRCWRYPRWPR